MARPKRVYPNQLPLFNKKHTRKVRMISGVEITGLHLVKETEQYYISIDSWAFCCSKFKGKKNKTELKYEIPILENEEAIKVLRESAWDHWKNWKDKQLKAKDPDITETVKLLDDLFPGKEKVYFYELKSLVGSFCHGDFLSYGSEYSEHPDEIETPNKHNLEMREYYNRKHFHGDRPQYVLDLAKEWTSIERTDANEKIREAALTKYMDEERKWITKNHDMTDDFVNIGKYTIVCPYIFTDPSVKGFTYEHAGEVYMVVTEDTVYFEIDRHF